MAYEPVTPGRHPAFHYGTWHVGPLCSVTLLNGPTALWVWCAACRCVAQLETVADKIAVEGSGEEA